MSNCPSGSWEAAHILAQVSIWLLTNAMRSYIVHYGVWTNTDGEAAGTNGNAAKTIRSSFISLISPMRKRHDKKASVDTSIPPYAELEHPNGNVSNPELPALPPSPVELSPESERRANHRPRCVSASSWTDTTSNAGTAPTEVEGSVVSPMSPNLDLPIDDKRGRREGDKAHVMSWIDYNRGQPSPAR